MQTKPALFVVAAALAAVFCNPAAIAQSGAETSSSAVTDVQAEDGVVAAARQSALADDDMGVDVTLFSGLSDRSVDQRSVTLARRAVGVCGWLRNDNEYGRAMRLAERVLQRLAGMSESNDTDRVERLYWESVLLAGILGRKADALVKLQEAERLAPDDDRILQSEQQLAQALGSFGR